MKILLRENDGKVWALDPDTGANLTTIANPPTLCDNDGRQGGQGTGYAHPTGIYWNSWEGARRQLASHDIITDDEPNGETPTINFIENGGEEPAKTPIINRAKFDPADMLAENMTIRQAYKCAVMPAIAEKNIAGRWYSPATIAEATGDLADAMIEEDRQHEAKGT